MIYWVEIPHPFFLATLWGSLTDWTLWIPLVFTAYFLLLLVSVYGVVKSVSDEWTGVAAAAVAGGFPVLFGFGRFIHDTLPIAALCTFMVWMALYRTGSDAGADAWLSASPGGPCSGRARASTALSWACWSSWVPS